MFKPEGITVAMVTPMNEKEEVEENVLRKLVHKNIEAGLHGIFCLSTNGEFFTLTPEEKIKIMKIVVEEAEGEIPVWAGTGAITTSSAVALTKKAEKIGVDVVSVITPYFLTPSQEELYEHYKKIARSVNLPIILYNLPERTGNSIKPETVAKLSRIENIVGIKDSSGDFKNTLDYIEHTGDEFAVLSGDDGLLLWTLLAGGNGGVCGTANIFPEKLVSIYNLWQKGEIAEARKVQKSLTPLRQAFGLSSFPAVVKALMELKGYEVGPPRSPISSPGQEVMDQLREVLEFYKEI